MSFLIEDILKRDNYCESQDHGKKANYTDPQNFKKQFRDSYDDSILQQTLLNKTGSVYYKPYREPCHRIYSGWPYLQTDRIKDHLPHMYKSVNFWPHSFTTLPMFLFPANLAHSKRKGGQVRFTAQQTDALEKSFTSQKYLSPEDRRRLASSLKLTDRQVKTWFQNRRAKWRRSSSSSSDNININDYNEDASVIKDSSVKGAQN